MDSTSVVSEYDIKKLKSLVYKLNEKLYSTLNATKERKFQALLPKSDHDPANNVVTIPEDLPMSDIQKQVLGKGLKWMKMTFSMILIDSIER